jgi:enoyl-CoA hydratase/carnithine racemase
MYRDILYTVEDPIATITMNRPENLNAFTTRMLAEIKHALAAAERDERVVGIILTGAGRGFCAGMDINALDAASSAGRVAAEDLSQFDASPGDPEMGENFQVAFSYLLSIRKPLVAAINGACAGLGFCFALLCDMRFVDKSARFTTAFSQRGLIAEHGASWMLPRLIGPSRALDLLWSARKFDGVEADRLGLVDRLCEPGTALAQATAYLQELARTAAPMSLMVMKQQVYRHLNAELGDAWKESIKWMDQSLKRSDFREGVRSFIEKRAPKFARIKTK